MRIEGKVIRYGDNVDTDVIIAGKYTKTLQMQELAEHAFEDLDPAFGEKARTASIIVAGRNFGCGSSREQAVLAIQYSGIRCVVADSFARIFYRNAINCGLVLIETDTSGITDGDVVSYEMGASVFRDETTGTETAVCPLPPIMRDILKEGGLTGYLKKHGGYRLDQSILE